MFIVDMHCDTIRKIADKKMIGEIISLEENKLQLDLKRMKRNQYLLQNFALFVKKEIGKDLWETVQKMIDIYETEIENNKDNIEKVLCFEDIQRNIKNRKMSALLSVEEGGVCQGDINKLIRLYEQGVRMMTLTWNFSNELGCSCQEQKGGLTELGREFVCKMQQMGMIVDVSHLSDDGFWDVFTITNKPFVASHSNARAVCNHKRNLTDHMIRALSERGGVCGLNFYPYFLKEKNDSKNNCGILECIVKHADHIFQVGGEECLGIGSDFDGMDFYTDLSGVEDMEKIVDTFKKKKFTASQIDKIFGKNVLRVYSEII